VIPRDYKAIRNPSALLRSAESDSGLHTQQNTVNSGRIISYSSGAFNTYREGNQLAPASLSQRFCVPIRIWVSGTTPVDKTLDNNVRRRNIGIIRPVLLRTGDL